MSAGTEKMDKLAAVVGYLVTGRRTVPELASLAGLHRNTVTKWLGVLQDRGRVRPNGHAIEPHKRVLLWEWVR